MTATWDIEEFRNGVATTTRVLADYVAASQDGEVPAVSQPEPAAIAELLDLRRWIREGGMNASSLEPFLVDYLGASTRVHHPASLAHQVAVPDIPAALADLVHGATNNPMAIYEMGAGAATAELVVLEWMLEQVGFAPAEGAGVLTHGGSLANLTALLAARARIDPDAWKHGVSNDLALLVPPSAHYSITRSAAMLGLGEDAVIALDVDDLDRIRTDRLDDALERADAAGRRPMALVATACATSTGLYDDLETIAGFCRARGVWLHVDAAHGASALLSPRHRHLLTGIHDADSVTWDAHKLLRTSSLCAAVLVRRAADLDRAFAQEAGYLFYDRDAVGVDLIGRTVECTKAELGLKLLLVLAWRGEHGIAEYISAQHDKAQRFHDIIATRDGFTTPFRPESNIVCFRFGDDDREQITIRDRLLRDGEFHVSSAEVGGRRHLRLTVMAPATDATTIERLLDRIESLVDQGRARRPGEVPSRARPTPPPARSPARPR